MNSNTKTNQQSSFAIHKFGDVLINQANGDCVLSGVTIPHGYVNATQIIKAAIVETGKQKRWSDYIKHPRIFRSFIK